MSSEKIYHQKKAEQLLLSFESFSHTMSLVADKQIFNTVRTLDEQAQSRAMEFREFCAATWAHLFMCQLLPAPCR